MRALPFSLPAWVAACAATLLLGPWTPLTPASAAAADGRIVGGRPTAREWPAFAQLRIGGFLCGGTLIAPAWVLTAAHCVEDEGTPVAPGTIRAILGRNNRLGTGGEERVGAQVVVHEADDAGAVGRPADVADLALIRLDAPATKAPQPLIGANEAALSAPGTSATILGFGNTRPDDGVGSPPLSSIAAVLMEAQVPITTDEACEQIYREAFDAAVSVCAGYPEGGTDTCQGDSGGPLLVPLGASALRLTGVTSFGFGCAKPGFPGVYTRLQTLQRWVRDRIAVDGLAFAPATPLSDEEVTFTATSTSPDPASALGGEPTQAPILRWDLDGDGFDDGSGATVTGRLAGAGERTVALEATRGSVVTVTRSRLEVRSPPPTPITPSSVPTATPAVPSTTPTPTPVPTPSVAPPVLPPKPEIRPRPRPEAAPARTALNLVAKAPGRPARRATLTCRPTGGSWSARGKACLRLERDGGARLLLRRPPRLDGRLRVSRASLEITGRVQGMRVALRLPRRGSRALRTRYRAVRALLGASAVDALSRR